LFIHRWLGLITGLVVFVVSVTGCIFCFQDEIQDAIHSWRKVPVQQKVYISPSRLKSIALAKYPGSSANYIYYFGKDRQMVVGISVIVFVVLMITGIILWWPKRKTDRKRSFTIKWNGRWRRINYDLHNVLGFYATSIALLLATTGLAISFEWVNKGIYAAANLGRDHASERIIPKSDTTILKGNSPMIDQAFAESQALSPHAEMFLITDDAGKSSPIIVTAYAQSLHYGHSDFYYFDRYSGKLLKQLPYAQKSPGMKLNDMNYDLHVGQAMGLFGKILAFLASLICASLPVTGFIIWLGKKK